LEYPSSDVGAEIGRVGLPIPQLYGFWGLKLGDFQLNKNRPPGLNKIDPRSFHRPILPPANFNEIDHDFIYHFQ
jgi:hypothetical protein